MVQRLIGTVATVVLLLCGGAGSAEAQARAATAIAIVVAPTDRIVFTGAPAAMQHDSIQAGAAVAGGTILRTGSTASDAGLGRETAQDVCATRRNEDPAWLVRSSQLSVTRTASSPMTTGVSREPTLVCTLVAP